MKRLTALALAGVLLLGTACGGGNQTNNEAAADAGTTPAQEQTTDGAEETAADSAAEGTTDSADDGTEGQKTESTPGGQSKGDAKGGKGDAIITEDENVYTGDGTVTAFIGEPFYDGVIKDEQEAYKAVESVYDRIGADSTTRLELAEIRPTEENICYTFAQIAGDIRVYGDAIKLITDKDGKAIGLVSAILPNVKAAPVDEWGITAEEAEAIIEDYYKDGDVHAVDGATDKILMPMEDGAEIYCYAWVVYTENFSTQYDAAYLAHYVKSDGEYLYALPISEPHNADALAGDVTAFVFDKMEEAGMDGDDQCYFWMNVALAMTPRTDFAQMAQILPWCMKSAGYPQYEDAVLKALEETGYSNRDLPDNAGEGKALLTFTYSAPEKYQDYDPAVMLFDQDDDDHSIYTWPEGGTGQVAIVVPEGRYAMTLILENEERDLIYYLYSEDGWESYDREGIEEMLGDLDTEYIFEAGSGEHKEFDAPEW